MFVIYTLQHFKINHILNYEMDLNNAECHSVHGQYRPM